jgi:nucleotide-binding universal stress UspA family protein
LLRSILLALDGIADGTAAIESAVALAARHGAAIDLRLTLDRAAIAAPEAAGVGGVSRAAHREVAIASRLAARLDEVAQVATARLAEAGLHVQPVRLDGDVRSELPRLAVQHDLMVLSNALRRRAEDTDDLDVDFALPIEELIRATARPIVLADARPVAEGPVLVAYDGGRAAATTLHLAALLGLLEGRKVEVLTVDGGDPEVGAQDVCALLDRHGAMAEPRTVPEAGDTADTICAEIEARDPALVVLGAFGDRMLKQWLFGSTTREVLRRAAPPIFLHT